MSGTTGIKQGNVIVPTSNPTGAIQFTPASEYIGMALQEFYHWTSNASFYNTMTPFLKPFYRKVQNWERWINGIVPEFHDLAKGVIPTHFAKAIVDKVSALIYGGGIALSCASKDDDSTVENDTLKFAGEWRNKVKLSSIVQTAIRNASGLGTTCFKLNADAEKDLWLETIPMSRAKYDFDHNGQIIGAKFYMAVFERGTSDKGYVYGLCEHRYYETNEKGDRIPYCEYRMYRIYMTVNIQQAPTETYVKWEDLEHWAREQLKSCYAYIRLDKPIRLPFTNLGLFAYKWTESCSSMPHLKYGDSVLEGLTKYLCEYDILSSILDTEMYLGRAKVIASSPIKNSNNKTNAYNSGLDSFIYYIESMSTEGQPFNFVQPEIRAEQLKSIRNTLLENIATAIGIAPSSFAQYLQDSSNRTAREVSAEESATTLFVENMRRRLEIPINQMLADVLRYYGYVDDVEIRWTRAGMTNQTILVETLARAKEAGLISGRKAHHAFNFDDDEEQNEEDYALVLEEQQQQGSAGPYDFPFGAEGFEDFGGGDVGDNEGPAESTGAGL